LRKKSKKIVNEIGGEKIAPFWDKYKKIIARMSLTKAIGCGIIFYWTMSPDFVAKLS